MKKEKNFGVFAWMLCAMTSLCGCMAENNVVPASGTTLVNVEKNVEYSAPVVDALCSSIADIDVESSTIVIGDDGTDVRHFSPTAYLNVKLAEEHIELASADEAEVTLVDEKVISDNEVSDGAIRGRDVVKEYRFSDGQIATVSYGWQYEMTVVAEQVAAPHVEISSIRYINHVVENTGVGTYTATPAFDAILVTKSVSNAETESLTLRPWYTMSVVAPEPEPEPEYTFEVVWGEWFEGNYSTQVGAYQPVTVYAHKSVGGEVVKTDETTFHLYTPTLREQDQARAINATSGNTGNLEVTSYDEDSFERGGFFHTTHVTKFDYVWGHPEYFRFQTSLVELVYTDGDYSTTLEVGLDTTWKKQEDVVLESRANNPDFEGARYLGTDIFTFSSEKVVRTDANYTEEDASGEGVMTFTFNIDKFIYE